MGPSYLLVLLLIWSQLTCLRRSMPKSGAVEAFTPMFEGKYIACVAWAKKNRCETGSIGMCIDIPLRILGISARLCFTLLMRFDYCFLLPQPQQLFVSSLLLPPVQLSRDAPGG